jgi:hypothetical protein
MHRSLRLIVQKATVQCKVNVEGMTKRNGKVKGEGETESKTPRQRKQ